MANKLTVLASVVAASSAMLSLSASAAESTLDKVLSQGFYYLWRQYRLTGFF